LVGRLMVRWSEFEKKKKVKNWLNKKKGGKERVE
jgi:hypothetical protein